MHSQNATVFFIVFKRSDFLINGKLRKEMTDAFAAGDYKRALKLSQKLDKQIFSHYSNRRKSKKTVNKEINYIKEDVILICFKKYSNILGIVI